MLFFYFLLLETAPKIQNISKYTKEQEMFAKWTRDGVQHQFNKNWLDRQKWGSSGTHRTSHITKKPNLYPHQSIITLYTLLWDTLYSVSNLRMFFSSSLIFLSIHYHIICLIMSWALLTLVKMVNALLKYLLKSSF